jgi:hypothetical protein
MLTLVLIVNSSNREDSDVLLAGAKIVIPTVKTTYCGRIQIFGIIIYLDKLLLFFNPVSRSFLGNPLFPLTFTGRYTLFQAFLMMNREDIMVLT